MKKLIFLCFIACYTLLLFCSYSKEEIKGIRLSGYFDVFSEEDEKVYVLEGTNDIFFYKNLELYKKEGVFVDAQNMEHVVFNYWVYNRQTKIGRKYDWKNPKIGIVFNVDSFLFRNAFATAKLYNKNDMKFIRSTKNSSADPYVDTYLELNKQAHYSFPDTTHFYFDDRLVNIPYSFSTELDSLRKSKVTRVLQIFSADDKSKHVALRKKRVYDFRFEQINEFDQKTILAFFESFANDTK